MNELYKALVRMAADAAERKPLTTKKEMLKSLLIFSIPVLIIVTCAILSYWIYVSPLWYIALAIVAGIIYLVAFMGAQISGKVAGAKYALQNPRNGETWIEITDEGESIWTSEKFIPLPALPEQKPLEISTSEIYTPDREADYLQWITYWDEVIDAMRKIKSKKAVLEELGKRGYPNDPRTYDKILLAGMAGKLTLQEFKNKFRHN